MGNEHIRFAPEMLRRLGEELVPHVDQGLVELVRNSYDADALVCKVELLGAERPGGTIRITDDGIGMDADTIRSGWLILGSSTKPSRRFTDLGRRPVGEKGLGRLAALRFGQEVSLKTRPKSESGWQYELIIDWALYDSVSAVEDVPLTIVRNPTDSPQGTEIEIRGIQRGLNRRDILNLARSLLLLADPFAQTKGFRPILVAPDFEDLEKRVQNSYFDVASYHFVAELGSNGKATAKVFDRNKRVIFEANHENIIDRPRRLASATYETVPAKFELWPFLLSSGNFSNTQVTVGEVRSWLEVVGGIHVYHRGLRVHPYGDSGHDWLDMNLSRARSPEDRPSTNTSIGRVIIDDPSDLLVPKTDRTGFIENQAFLELRRFAIDSLDWMGRERRKQSEVRRQATRKKAEEDKATARQDLNLAMQKLPNPQRPAVETAIKALGTLEKAVERESKALKEDLQLYRTLASVGTTAAVFAHESSKPVDNIELTVKSIQRRLHIALGKNDSSSFDDQISMVLRSTKALQSFANLPLALLDRDKRAPRNVDVNEAIQNMLLLFEPFLTDAQINHKLEKSEGSPKIWGSVAAIESIVSNLITNAVNALTLPGATVGSRTFILRTAITGNTLLVSALDSGPGINSISVEEIWLPGRTTTVGGTGLGLTIVRDTVADLGGSVHARAQGELGGAEITVEIPLSETV